MELEIQNKKENPLLDRTEVHFILHHPNHPSPKREAVREALSKELSVQKDRIVVDHLKSSFGIHDTKGYAKIYSKKEVAKEIEREHLLKRNNLLDKKEKKEEPKEEAKEAAAQEEPKEEKPAEAPEKPKGEE